MQATAPLAADLDEQRGCQQKGWLDVCGFRSRQRPSWVSLGRLVALPVECRRPHHERCGRYCAGPPLAPSGRSRSQGDCHWRQDRCLVRSAGLREPPGATGNARLGQLRTQGRCPPGSIIFCDCPHHGAEQPIQRRRGQSGGRPPLTKERVSGDGKFTWSERITDSNRLG
jgi:hypothetical protein